VEERSRVWREYCCESFCDTAAFVYGIDADRSEVTLSGAQQLARAAWFAQTFRGGHTFAI
jgi:hypothetical protein